MTHECLVLYSLEELYEGQETVESTATTELMKDFLQSEARIDGTQIKQVVLQSLEFNSLNITDKTETYLLAKGTIVFAG